MAETIENNVRKIITDEQPINPKYYEKMSDLLDALIKQRRKKRWNTKPIWKIAALTKKVRSHAGASYPKALNTAAKRALFDNLGQDEASRSQWTRLSAKAGMDDWRGNAFKIKKMMFAIKAR